MKLIFKVIIGFLAFTVNLNPNLSPNLSWSSSEPSTLHSLRDAKFEKLGVQSPKGIAIGEPYPEQLGLKKGDIISSVEGQPVDSPAQAMELYENLRARKKVTVTRPYKVRAKSLDAVMRRATSEEKRDIRKLLSQIELVRVRTDDNGRTLFSVRKVTKGSLYSRLGIKAGDYVYAKNSTD